MKPQGSSNLCWRNCFFRCTFCWIYTVLGKHICTLGTENKDLFILNSNVFHFSHSFVALILAVHYSRSKVFILVNFNTKNKSIYCCYFHLYELYELYWFYLSVTYRWFYTVGQQLLNTKFSSIFYWEVLKHFQDFQKKIPLTLTLF